MERAGTRRREPPVSISLISVVDLGARATATLPMTCSQEKDILPLPSPPVETRHGSGLSRGCVQRLGFRRYVVRDCVESINWFAGIHKSPVDSDVTEIQHPSIEGIRGAVRERAVDGRSQTFSKHETDSALLHGGMGMTPWTFPLVVWPCTTPRASVLGAASWGRRP